MRILVGMTVRTLKPGKAFYPAVAAAFTTFCADLVPAVAFAGSAGFFPCAIAVLTHNVLRPAAQPA